MKDLTEVARDLTRAPKDLPSLVARSNKLADSGSYGKRATKQQQLARLIVELGIDAAQVVFSQVRARLERIT